MNLEDFKDMSKRMVVEYYNRYVHNVEPDYEGIKIDKNYVKIIEENLQSNGIMELVLQVSIDIWIEYHVEYNPKAKNKISSFVTLS